MTRSVRARRRRAPNRRPPSPPPAPTWTVDGPTEPTIEVDPAPPTVGQPRPGTWVRWSHHLAALVLRVPALDRLDARLGPLINKGRLDRTDALAGLIRYATMGGLATLVYFATAVGLYQTGLGANVTSAIAIAVSVVVSFVIQSRVTFQSGRFDPMEAVRFLVVGAIGFTVSRVVVGTVYHRAGQPFWVAALVVCVIVPLANFAAMNFWVFAGDRGEHHG